MTVPRPQSEQGVRTAPASPEFDDRVHVRLDRVFKMYRVGDTGVAALSGVSLEIARGGFVALVGPSGSGKSSILNLIGGVETATAGVVEVDGTDLAQLAGAERTDYRRRTVGFLWQGAAKNLVPYLSAAQNVLLPLVLGGQRSLSSWPRVRELLDFLELTHRSNHLPPMLSGGEQQRLALAVALANGPRVVLADEPTAEVDRSGAERVVQALADARREFGATVVMATHDLDAAAKADMTYRLIEGCLRSQGTRGRVDGAGNLTLTGDAAATVRAADVEISVEEGEVRIRPLDVRSDRARPWPVLGQERVTPRPTGPRQYADRPSPGPLEAVVPILPLLTAEAVSRTYRRPGGDTTALRDVSVRLSQGQLVVLMGPSGSGKSTLLGILAGLDRPDEGRVAWCGRFLDDIPDEEASRLRATWLGVVFQALGLLPSLSAGENVVLPLLMAGVPFRQANDVAERWLGSLGLGERIDHRINELSVGQQQRVAIARALAPGPSAVLADEPTAEVDAEGAERILGTLQDVARRGGGVLVTTHDPRVVERADWVVVLRGGCVEQEGPPGGVATV
jgi:ABC-type lipoprotein export system ATPase subunit